MEESKLNQSLIRPPPADNKHFIEAKIRNMELIKVILLLSSVALVFRLNISVFPQNIEMSKARLRSRIIFSPLEDVLQKAIIEYKTNMHT